MTYETLNSQKVHPANIVLYFKQLGSNAREFQWPGYDMDFENFIFPAFAAPHFRAFNKKRYPPGIFPVTFRLPPATKNTYIVVTIC